MNATMHEQLQRARDIFAERGGAQYKMTDEHGRVCLFNALSIAVRGRSALGLDSLEEKAPIEPLAQAIGLTTSLDTCEQSNHVCVFNNTHSKGEILDRLNKALAAYEVVCA